MTSAIETYVKELGYAVSGCGARYEEGAVIVLLAFSIEAANNFLDKFVSGDSIYETAIKFEIDNPEYPIARGATWAEAFDALEKKLYAAPFLDGDWRLGIEVALSEYLYGVRE